MIAAKRSVLSKGERGKLVGSEIGEKTQYNSGNKDSKQVKT